MNAKPLWGNNFLALMEIESYTFCHEVRTDGKTVSLLPFRSTEHGREYLARVEICPAHDVTQPGQYSITGGVRPGEAISVCAIRELKEEAGYEATESELIDLGTVRPSKMMDTTVYLYAVDVTDKTPQTIEGDGTRWETGASVKWVTLEQGLKNLDPLFITAILRLGGI